jgi:hypothetical protein
VIAAILIAGALIAVAIVFAGGDRSRPAAAPPTTAQAAAPPTQSTATCKAWRNADAALEAIPALPDGWDFNTPNIDTLIAQAKTAVDKVLDIFESQIVASDPPQVVSAAKAYMTAKRTEMAKAADHTITEADDTAVDTNRGLLKQLCSL